MLLFENFQNLYFWIFLIFQNQNCWFYLFEKKFKIIKLLVQMISNTSKNLSVWWMNQWFCTGFFKNHGYIPNMVRIMIMKLKNWPDDCGGFVPVSNNHPTGEWTCTLQHTMQDGWCADWKQFSFALLRWNYPCWFIMY